jgi:hypothetical protein
MRVPRRLDPVQGGQGRKALSPAIVGVAALLLLSTPKVGRAQDGRWQFGSVPSFSSGRYGTEARTEVLHTPISARRLFDDGDVTVVFPFMCVWGDEGVTVVNGTPVRQQRIASSTTRDVRAGRATTTSGPAIATRSCGLGDVVVRGRYYVLDERGWAPTIAIRGHVKVPTASAERGLGTGRADEGVGVEIGRTIAGGTMAMVDGGYTVIGKRADQAFNNNWWYDVGVGQTLGRDLVNLSVFFEQYRSIVPGLENARDLLAAVTVTGAGGWRVQMSAEFGMSDGAPDHGFALGVSRRF